MAARFKANQILTLPKGLYYRQSKWVAGQSEPASVMAGCLKNRAETTPLDGKYVKLLACQIALLGMSVHDMDGYIYTAEVGIYSDGQWRRDESAPLLSLPGTLVADNSLIVKPAPLKRAAPTRIARAWPQRRRAVALRP